MISRATLHTFLRFAFLSGMGWLCDFATFVILVEGIDVSAFVANFISSYVGVTFVYATSLRFVFNKVTQSHATFLSLYWGFQFVSILAYSALLKAVVWQLEQQSLSPLAQQYAGVTGKILVTPVNLLTNFIFMKFLTKYMSDEVQSDA